MAAQRKILVITPCTAYRRVGKAPPPDLTSHEVYAFDVERGPLVWGHDERQTMSEKMDQDDDLGTIRALIEEGESHQA